MFVQPKQTADLEEMQPLKATQGFFEYLQNPIIKLPEYYIYLRIL